MLGQLPACIAAEIRALSDQVSRLIQTACDGMQDVMQYAFQAPGKQVRPTLVYLAARTCGNLTPKTRRGALLVTLLHQASLAHDDVIDEATHRRGRPTIHAIWNNKVAVLLGDFLLAKILHLATQHQDHDLMPLITATAQTMSIGELKQLKQTNRHDTTETVYLDIIYKKTAHFFGTCLAIGAIAAGASALQIATMRQAGDHLGMAFQLKDDWLDYGTEEVGKPVGVDLKEGKLTLPLIHALQQASAHTRAEILRAIKQAQHQPKQREAIIDFVRQSKGMDYTRIMMKQYHQKALRCLPHTTYSLHQEDLRTFIKDLI